MVGRLPTAQRNFAALLFGFVVVLGACGGDAAPETSTTSPPLATTTSTTSSTSTTTTTTTTTTPPVVPGTEVDFGPKAGDVVSVVGVAHDDVLNVRALPGTDQEIVAELAPTTDDVTARGHTRQLPASIWFEVEADGTIGWVSSRFVAYQGDTVDDTAQVIALLGRIPSAETMSEMGQLVAETFASEDPPSSIVMSVAPSVGDLGEVTFDVVGLGDDSVFGLRLHVIGEEDEGGESFSLKTVETTLLCSRGVADGLCV